jgi:Proteasome subunit
LVNNKQATVAKSITTMLPLSPKRSSGGCMVSGRSLLSQIATATPVLLLLLHLVLLPRSYVVMGLPDAEFLSRRARIHGRRGAAAADEDCGLWIPQSHLGDTNDDPLLFQPSLDVDDDGTNRPPFGGLSIPKSLRLHSPAAAAAAAEQEHQEENEDTAVTGTLRRRNWSSLSGVTKTGTTIVGVRTSSGVVLAADTRATEGSLVADMTCEKLQRTYKDRRIGWVVLERNP